MQLCLVKLCLVLTLIGFCITEWVEIQQAKSPNSQKSPQSPQPNPNPNPNPEESSFSTPSAEWIEYQRERFGVSQSNGLVVSADNSLKHSSQIMVPAKVQVIRTRTKIKVKNTIAPPMVEVDVTPKVETTSRRHSSHLSDEDTETVMETITETPNEEVEDNSEIQFPTMQGFLQFLKSMQNTWIKKSALSIEKKIKLLKQLRDNLMSAIEQQFSVLWQPTERKRRKRRGLLDESDLEFPPEAALMSINFLTFAVFLIKLVLQVVQIVKSKHYSFSGFDVNTEVIRNP